MMKFTPIASSSRGNAYLAESKGVAPLLLEAGIPIKKLWQKLGFGLTGLAGCLISHEHMDHAKAVKDLLKASVDCYMSERTAEALKVDYHHRVRSLKDIRVQFISKWAITPFNLKHDAAEPLGFYITNLGSGENLLFIPDTAYMKNCFSGVTIIAVECNHISDILSDNIRKEALLPVVGRRVRRNHMSLETLVKMLKANDLSKCREIHLLHLSDGNSDEARMIKEVQQVTGIPTYACNT